MTEKRFTLIDMNNIEWDLISPIKDNGDDLTVNQVLDVLNAKHEENMQLKIQIKIFEEFLKDNNLDIDWEYFCTVEECLKTDDDYGCKECKYLGSDV